MALYRINLDEFDKWERYVQNGLLIPVDPAFYVYQHRGLSDAIYMCHKEDADGAVFDINLIEEQR